MKPFYNRGNYVDISTFFVKKVEASPNTQRTISSMNKLLVPKLNLNYIRTGSTSVTYSQVETESSSLGSYKSFVNGFFPDHSTESDEDEKEDVKITAKNVCMK